MMSQQLDWTQQLGDAVLAQQADVMDAIQRLRTKAQANGKLESTKEQKVEVTQQADKQVIVIEPASPETYLCALLRSGGGLRHVALSGVPGVLLSAGPVLWGRGRALRAVLPGARASPLATRFGTMSTGGMATSMSTSTGM